MIKKLVVILFALFSYLGFNPSYATADTPDEETLNQLDAYVKEQFANNRVIGGSYAIVAEGKVVAAEGIGVADVETGQPVTPETVYSTASVTKTFTATAILQLYEKGLVTLDAPVKDYLPWFTYEDESRSLRVTVRHLLTHSPGINRLEGDGALFKDEERNRDSLEDSVRSLRFVSMAAEPGTKAAYCNSCFNTLGMVIKQVTGMDYEAYIRERILAPLKMDDTTFYPGTADQLASEYNWVFGLKHKSEFNNIVFGESQNPEGGIYSNVLDLSTFLSALMEKNKQPVLMRKETMSLSQQGEVSAGGDAAYSISGFEETSIAGTKVLFKSGDGIGSAAMIMMLPEKEIGISILIGDSIPEFGGPLATGMATMLLGKTPEDFEIGMTFWKMAGLVSLILTCLSLLLLVLVMRSFLQFYKSDGTVKRRWLVAARGIFFLMIAIPVGYMVIAIRPSQIGFYGYPVDIAIGLISIAAVSFLWSVHSFIALLIARNSKINIEKAG